eukprot:3485428-Prorocentrum_lima.AAC.1
MKLGIRPKGGMKMLSVLLPRPLAPWQCSSKEHPSKIVPQTAARGYRSRSISPHGGVRDGEDDDEYVTATVAK